MAIDIGDDPPRDRPITVDGKMVAMMTVADECRLHDHIAAIKRMAYRHQTAAASMKELEKSLDSCKPEQRQAIVDQWKEERDSADRAQNEIQGIDVAIRDLIGRNKSDGT